MGHLACSRCALRGRNNSDREDAVLICRCAWHRRYRGYPRLSGVASWRGWTVKFTDGICERCLQRFRAEHQRYLERRTQTPTTATA